jgi:hypothetical protein
MKLRSGTERSGARVVIASAYRIGSHKIIQ